MCPPHPAKDLFFNIFLPVCLCPPSPISQTSSLSVFLWACQCTFLSCCQLLCRSQYHSTILLTVTITAPFFFQQNICCRCLDTNCTLSVQRSCCRLGEASFSDSQPHAGSLWNCVPLTSLALFEVSNLIFIIKYHPLHVSSLSFHCKHFHFISLKSLPGGDCNFHFNFLSLLFRRSYISAHLLSGQFSTLVS